MSHLKESVKQIGKVGSLLPHGPLLKEGDDILDFAFEPYGYEKPSLTRKKIIVIFGLVGLLLVFFFYPLINHYVIFPLMAPRFDGIIVCVDDEYDPRDWGGYVTIYVDGKIMPLGEKSTIDGGGIPSEYVYPTPKGKEIFMVVFIKIQTETDPLPRAWLRVRLLDGRTQDVLAAQTIKGDERFLLVSYQGTIH